MSMAKILKTARIVRPKNICAKIFCGCLFNSGKEASTKIRQFEEKKKEEEENKEQVKQKQLEKLKPIKEVVLIKGEDGQQY